MTARNWCATIWALPPPNLDKCPEKVTVKYLIAQREFTAKEGKAHWQTYMEIKTPVRAKQAMACLGLTSKDCHIETRKGTREQARAYCTREKPDDKKSTIDLTTPIVEIGEWVPEKRGTRNDLIAAIKTGSIQKVREKHPEVLVRYPRGLQAVFADDRPRDRTTPLKLFILWGPTGTGKSLWAFNKYPDAWVKPRGEWWCGYSGEQTIIWDEFSPKQCDARDFMQWFDRYPCRAPCKGGQVSLRFKTAIITAHGDPEKWWPGRFEEIMRRIEDGGGALYYTQGEDWDKIINPILEEEKAKLRPPNNDWVDDIFDNKHNEQKDLNVEEFFEELFAEDKQKKAGATTAPPEGEAPQGGDGVALAT